MKKYLFFIFILSIVVISSGCKKSTPSAPASASNAGKVWKLSTSATAFDARDSHSSVVYDNKMWVIGGDDHTTGQYLNDVWYSSNGADWTLATANAAFSARCEHSSVVFDNDNTGLKMWVIAGSDNNRANFLNDVWSSSDGINWSCATPAASFCQRAYCSSLVYNSKIWVIGGEDTGWNAFNDVWYSSNGADWVLATGNAAFAPRYAQSSVVFNNKMWVIGGSSSHTGSDVWYSTDGITWTESTVEAPLTYTAGTYAVSYPGRWGQTSVIYDNLMWVIGGSWGIGDLNDIWYSPDGTTWNEATSSASFAQRAFHTSVVFNNEMWVISGYTGEVLSDVWSSP